MSFYLYILNSYLSNIELHSCVAAAESVSVIHKVEVVEKCSCDPQYWTTKDKEKGSEGFVGNEFPTNKWKGRKDIGSALTSRKCKSQYGENSRSSVSSKYHSRDALCEHLHLKYREHFLHRRMHARHLPPVTCTTYEQVFQNNSRFHVHHPHSIVMPLLQHILQQIQQFFY